jgi:putative tricarboxylic transport membrane protein
MCKKEVVQMRNKGKAKLEIGINLLFSGIVVGMFIFSKDYDFLEGTILGARTFPILIGGILVIFASVNITGAVKRLVNMNSMDFISDEEPEITEDYKGSPFNQFIRKYRVGCGFLLVTLYYLLLMVVGFIIATVMMIPSMLYLLEYRKVFKVIIITVLGTTFLYTAFHILLGVPLPEGLLFY